MVISRLVQKIAVCLSFLVCGLAVTAGEAGDGVIDVGNRKQLFVDNKLIASSQNVTLTMNAPYQTGELLIRADQPHEKDSLVYLLGSVVQDGGKVRIWYDLLKGTKERRICYAESDDGVNFTKPVVGIHEIHGSTANNVVIPGIIGGSSVWIDPKAPPEHRYKTQAKSYEPTGFQMHSSPDGLNWNLFGKVNPNGHADSQTIVFWDPRIQRYVFYSRGKEYLTNGTERVGKIRMIRRQESDDLLNWDTQSLVLSPDADDMATHAVSGPLPPLDYYGATVFKYPFASETEATGKADDRVYIMLAQAFWHFTERGYDGVVGPGTRDVRLLTSRDGLDFQRAGKRQAFMRPGPAGRFDSKQIWVLPNPVRMGDEIWFYYAATNEDRTQRPEQRDRIDPEAPGRQLQGGISRAILRLDGFVSADAPYEGGELVTPCIRFEGDRLELNADTAGGGSLIVELLDQNGNPIPGFTREEAIPLCGNSVRLRADWGEGKDLSQLAGRPIRMRFLLQDCKLYAFQFRN